MDKSEKRFERDIEAFLISPQGGYVQFNGQDADGNWVHSRQHDVEKCIYMDVLCEFIAKTQPKEWAKYTRYYGDRKAVSPAGDHHYQSGFAPCPAQRHRGYGLQTAGVLL